MAEYIDKNALDRALTVAAANGNDKDHRTWAKAICVLHDMPAADVAPVRHGHWIENGDCQICSECGEEHCWGEYRAAYCDSCGAKMDKDGGAADAAD